MAEVSARAKEAAAWEAAATAAAARAAATGAQVVVAVGSLAALEGKMWVYERKCRSFRNCRGSRRSGIRHCTRNGPAEAGLSRKGEAPPPRPFAQEAGGIRAGESPPSRCRRLCRDKRADPAAGAVGADGVALAAEAAAAALGELGEPEAEGERIRRNRRWKIHPWNRRRPLAFCTYGRDARSCELQSIR